MLCSSLSCIVLSPFERGTAVLMLKYLLDLVMLVKSPGLSPFGGFWFTVGDGDSFFVLLEKGQFLANACVKTKELHAVVAICHLSINVRASFALIYRREWRNDAVELGDTWEILARFLNLCTSLSRLAIAKVEGSMIIVDNITPLEQLPKHDWHHTYTGWARIHGNVHACTLCSVVEAT